MLRWPLVLGLVFTLNAYAIDDERVIKEMARTSSLSADEIRANYKTGCDSGAYVPMLTCSRFAYIAADLELNDLYKKLARQLTTESAKSKLIKAQKAWITFRDLTCEYESDGYSGGRDWSIIHFGCLGTVTDARIGQLNNYLKCTDPGCPGEW